MDRDPGLPEEAEKVTSDPEYRWQQKADARRMAASSALRPG